MAHAHHSGAMFDRSKDVVLNGVVKEWQWNNPHCWLIVEVLGEEAKTVVWSLEGQSPQVFRGKGWTRDLLRVGDKVIVHMAPLRDGSAGGSLVSVQTADGRVYN
jgi:hypothetical protein